MQHRAWGLAALAAAVVAAMPAAAQETTPAMVAAAEKEGKVVWYNSVDVKVAEAIAKAFKEKYPKIDVQVERTGSERVLQRVNQEMQAGIKNADVVNSSDASHFIFWKKQGWLAKHTPPDTLKFDAKYRDPEGYYQTWRASLDHGRQWERIRQSRHGRLGLPTRYSVGLYSAGETRRELLHRKLQRAAPRRMSECRGIHHTRGCT